MNNNNINANPEAEVIIETDAIYNGEENTVIRQSMFDRIWEENTSTNSAFDKLFS